jgi:hypothetical protein
MKLFLDSYMNLHDGNYGRGGARVCQVGLLSILLVNSRAVPLKRSQRLPHLQLGSQSHMSSYELQLYKLLRAIFVFIRLQNKHQRFQNTKSKYKEGTAKRGPPTQMIQLGPSPPTECLPSAPQVVDGLLSKRETHWLKMSSYTVLRAR